MHIRYDKMLGTRLPLLFCLGAFFCGALAGEKAGNGSEHPLLLYEHPLPPPRENPDSNAAIPPESTSGGDKQTKKQESADRSGTKFRMGLGYGIPNSPPSVNNKTDEPVPPSGEKGFSRGNARKMEKNGGASPTNMPTAVLPATEETPPTPEAVEQYRVRLEQRLLERYNNIPDYAGKVARVAVVVSKPMEVSFDARLIRVEFDQLVFDNWGKRLPALEKEYYAVTFGSGGVEQVRSDPSIRIGLDMERTYSERAPLTADPFRNIQDDHTFKATPTLKMPDWWRPEFPELD